MHMICVLSRPMPPPAVAWLHNNAAGDRLRRLGAAGGSLSKQAGKGRVRVPRIRMCTVRARRLWRAVNKST